MAVRRQKSRVIASGMILFYVLGELADINVGVFGLDNRRITKHNCGNLFSTTPLSVPQVTQLYDFPTNSAAGQTIGIFMWPTPQ
jgi:hypothetical protein